MRYAKRVHGILTPAEQQVFVRLNSPIKIQDYLDTLPINFELSGETYYSPRAVLREKKAHCLEGAVFAAAALAFHGHKPLLMDLQTADPDDDHVVALFRNGKYWGAISKTNHAVLRYRDAIYPSISELARSYFHEYFLEENGKKTLRAYSAPFDLTRFEPAEWVTTEEHLHGIVDALDWSRHFPVVSVRNIRRLRPASRLERKTIALTEWKPRDYTAGK